TRHTGQVFTGPGLPPCPPRLYAGLQGFVRVPPAGEDRKAKENRARVVVREGQPGRVVEVHPADRARSGERRESLRPDRPDVTLRLQDLEPRGGEVGTLALGAVDERVYRFTDLLDVDVLRQR